MENAFIVQAASFLAAALVMGIGSISPAYGQGLVGSKACEYIGKHPEGAKDIRGAMGFTIIMVETSAIYCLLIALVILFLGRA